MKYILAFKLHQLFSIVKKSRQKTNEITFKNYFRIKTTIINYLKNSI